MSIGQPPRIAMFLLRRFAVGPRHESLVGDLVEQYAVRRSRKWFWRQTASAIAAGLLRELGEHKWLATRAVILGWAAMWVGAVVANWFTIRAGARLLEYLTADGSYSADEVFWSAQIPGIAFTYLAFAACGWAIARSQRRAPSTFILFAATVFLFEYGFASWMLANAPPRLFTPSGEWVLPIALIGRPMALLMGGLVGLSTKADLKVRATYS